MRSWIFDIIRKRGLTFLLGLIFAVLCFVALNIAMKPVSTSEYCGSKCHEMNTAYQSWKLSEHGANKYGIRVECVDCHLPSKDKFFTHITAKTYAGVKDLYKHHFGGEYDVEKTRKEVLEKMTNSRCLKCHDDLLTKAGSAGARMAHQDVLNSSNDLKLRCLDCHEHLHEREKKIFSPH